MPRISISTNGDLIRALSDTIAAHEACAAKVKAISKIYKEKAE